MAERKKLGLDDFFTFGKHQDEQVEFVLDNDAQYIKYCIERKICDFDDAVRSYYEEVTGEELDPDFLGG